MPLQWIPDSARQRPGALDLGNGWELHQESKLEHCYECDNLALHHDVLRDVYLCSVCTSYELKHGTDSGNFPWTGVVYKSEGDDMSYTRKQFEDVARILRVQVTKARDALAENEAEIRPDAGRWNCDQGKLIALENVAKDFAAYFAFDNDAFDRERFLASAGFTAT